MAAYDDAIAELYQSPVPAFVAERKRLAAGLKAAGDKAGGARFAKLGRPTISAWVVNQLWWHCRDAFTALLETAERLRRGQLDATAAHRDAIAKLRARAATLLADAGHGTTESTLRRVTMTLAAIAATGGFDPDPPGALAEDRDPPGFEAVGIGGIATPAPVVPLAPAATADDGEAARRTAADEARARAQAAAEQRKLEEARLRRQAERHRVEAALTTATGEIQTRTRELDKLHQQIAIVAASIEQAKAAVADLETKLAELTD